MLQPINIFEDDILQQMLADDNQNPPVDDYKARQGNYTDNSAREAGNEPSQPFEGVETANAEDMPEAFSGVAQQEQPQTSEPKITSMYDLLRSQGEPKEDTELYANAKKAALMYAIGKVFGNIAGAVGSVAGANVPIIPDNQNLAKIYGIVDREKTKYNALKRDWDGRLIQAKMADAQQELANKRLAQQNELEKYKQQLAHDKWVADYNQKERKMASDAALREAAINSNNAYRSAALGLQAEKIKNDAAKTEGKNFMLYNEDGTAAKELSPGELEKIFGLIINDPAVKEKASTDLALLKSQFGEGVTKQHLYNIVARWWNNSPEAVDYIIAQQQGATAAARVKAANLDKSPSNPYMPYIQGTKKAEQPQNAAPAAEETDWSIYKRR